MNIIFMSKLLASDTWSSMKVGHKYFLLLYYHKLLPLIFIGFKFNSSLVLFYEELFLKKNIYNDTMNILLKQNYDELNHNQNRVWGQ